MSHLVNPLTHNNSYAAITAEGFLTIADADHHKLLALEHIFKCQRVCFNGYEISFLLSQDVPYSASKATLFVLKRVQAK